MSNELTRRQFFRLRPQEFARAIVERRARAAAGGPAPIRPPGALSEDAFVRTCERCRGCSGACPHGVIRHLGAAAGRAEGTPHLAPEEAPCRWCETMDCVHACGSGALRLVDGQMPEAIGTARIDRAACLLSEGVLCDTCACVCPGSIRGIRMVGRSPVVDEEACVGCGLCAHHCAASAPAIEIVGRV